MKRTISRRSRGKPTVVGITFFLFASLLGGLPAAAQTHVYTDQYGNPTVSVDLRVLDQLGPKQSLPDIYRTTAPIPTRPVMARRPAPVSGGARAGLLAPPPRTMPHSKLSLPAGNIPGGTATRHIGPPAAASVAPPPRPIKRLPPPVARSVPPAQPAPTVAVRRSAALTPIAPPKPPAAVLATPKPTARLAPPSVPTTPATPTVIPKSIVTAPLSTKTPAPIRPPLLAPPKTTLAKPVAPAPKPTTAPPPIKAPPAAQSRVAAAPASRPVGPVESISVSPDGNLYSIPFSVGTQDLPTIASDALNGLAERMKKEDDIRIQLIGFASNGGESASQARRRSLFRALAVRTHLMKEGIRSTRMDVRALGQTNVEGGPPDRVDIIVRK